MKTETEPYFSLSTWHTPVDLEGAGERSLTPDPTPPQVLCDAQRRKEVSLQADMENYIYGQPLTTFVTNYIVNKQHNTDWETLLLKCKVAN